MKRAITIMLSLVTSIMIFGQGANNIRINEVMTSNQTSLQDEFGNRNPWVEIVNTAFSTYNIRGMFITTDRTVLNKSLTVPQRMSRMSIIPNGDARTNLSARQHIVFFLNSNHNKGLLHLDANVRSNKPVWIALYDGNAIDLIDSVTIPVIPINTSYARKSDGADTWVMRDADHVTPGTDNYIQASETKIQKLKRDDPHGLGITALCMGIVFLCLALLYVFFLVFGWIADRRSRIASTQPVKPVVKTAKKINKVRHMTSNILQEGLEMKGRDKEMYVAVISMALKQYLEDIHDVESGVLTIKPDHSSWGAHTSFNNNVNHNTNHNLNHNPKHIK
ncbi:MAG: OadG family protein [Prevotella sp.]|nr:OadG family protein [Prevotella sp.]